MKPGRLASGCLRIIDRYQRSRGAAVFDKSCRFDPSCCTFMHDAFSTRAFPIAFLLSAGRLIRCNPLARRRTHDPVNQRSRVLTRPNALRTASALMLAAGLVLLLVSSAQAQIVTGGCTAAVDGRSVAEFSSGNPLEVKKGQTVSVVGTVPPAFSGGGTVSSTRIEVALIDPVLKAGTGETRTATGSTWGGSVNVDRYLDLGKGLYKIHANAVINAPGRGITSCHAIFYARLLGGQLIAAVAGTLAVAGGVGSVFAPGGKSAQGPVLDLDELDADVRRSNPAWDPSQEKGTTVDIEESVFGMPCGPVLVLSALAAFGVFGSAGGGAMAMPAPAPGTILLSKRVWKRGHPIVGFVSGLLFGLGITVFLQQQGVWILGVANAIVLPVALGLIAGARGWKGRAYRVTVRAVGAGGVPRQMQAQTQTQSARWAPTHTVTGDGLQAWARPDPTGQVIGALAARTELRVVERVGDWARVDGENGWTGWVNAQGLRAL